MRIGQGVGGALLMGNSSAILTDAFPHDQRGLALGVNAVAAIAGSFIGLVLGGLLGAGRLAARLPRLGARSACSARSGRTGSSRSAASASPRASTGGATSTFAVGLILVLVSITYGIQPYGGHSMGWTNPRVLG